MSITTTRPATASIFFERRAEHIRIALKDVDDRIAEREKVVAMDQVRGQVTSSTVRTELAHYKRKQRVLKHELQRALFNAGRRID